MPVMKRTALVGVQSKLLGKFLRSLERQPRVPDVTQDRFAVRGGLRHRNERAGYLELRPKKIHRKLARFSYDL